MLFLKHKITSENNFLKNVKMSWIKINFAWIKENIEKDFRFR